MKQEKRKEIKGKFDLNKMSEETGIDASVIVTKLKIDGRKFSLSELSLEQQKGLLRSMGLGDSWDRREIARAMVDSLLERAGENGACTYAAEAFATASGYIEDDPKYSARAFSLIIRLLTTDDAIKVWKSVENYLSTKRKKIFLRKWIDILNDFKIALRVRRIIRSTYEKHDPLWDSIFEKVLALAETADHMKSLSFELSCHPRYKVIPEQKRACEEKWDTLSLQEIKAADTLEAVYKARQTCRPDSDALKRAFRKGDKLGLVRAREATSLKAAKVVLWFVREDSKAASVAVAARERFASERIEKVRTFKEAKATFRSVFRCSCSEKMKAQALAKLLSFASDRETAKSAYEFVLSETDNYICNVWLRSEAFSHLASFYGWEKPEA